MGVCKKIDFFNSADFNTSNRAIEMSADNWWYFNYVQYIIWREGGSSPHQR